VPSADGGPADYYVTQVLDISERRHFEQQLHYLADHDPLTSLHNRRRFEAELDRVIAESHTSGEHGALLVLDLDGFKVVNDRFGHSVGDDLVAHIGGLLRQSVRRSDFIARLGGDEFAIILRDWRRAPGDRGRREGSGHDPRSRARGHDQGHRACHDLRWHRPVRPWNHRHRR